MNKTHQKEIHEGARGVTAWPSLLWASVTTAFISVKGLRFASINGLRPPLTDTKPSVKIAPIRVRTFPDLKIGGVNELARLSQFRVFLNKGAQFTTLMRKPASDSKNVRFL